MQIYIDKLHTCFEVHVYLIPMTLHVCISCGLDVGGDTARRRPSQKCSNCGVAGESEYGWCTRVLSVKRDD